VTFWWTHGYVKEGQSWLEQGLAVSGDVSTALRAKALTGLGTMAWLQDDISRAVNFHQDSLTLYRALEDQRGIAEALNNLGVQAYYQGNLEQAVPLLQESLQLYRAIGDKDGIAGELTNLGAVARLLGDPELAIARNSESLTLFRELGDLRWIAAILHNMALIATIKVISNRPCLNKESLLIIDNSEEKPDRLSLQMYRRTATAERAAQLLGAAAALRAPHTGVPSSSPTMIAL
jgi:tetratricopeptide (TPR) repeat protein